MKEIIQETGSNGFTVLKYEDETFNENQSFVYHLFIEVKRDRFTYMILDAKKETSLFFKSFRGQITQGSLDELLENAHFSVNYKSVKIILSDTDFILVPTPLFSEDNLTKLFEVGNSLPASNTLLFNRVFNQNFYSVFSIDKNILSSFKLKFPSAEIKHESSALLEIIASKVSDFEKNFVFISLRESNFLLVVYENEKLIFTNTFSFGNTEEMVYFTLAVCERFQIDYQNTKLFLSGNVEEHLPFADLLERYVSHVQIVSEKNNGRNNELMRNEKLYMQFFTLLNLYLCE